jgi:hypothetical protein
MDIILGILDHTVYLRGIDKIMARPSKVCLDLALHLADLGLVLMTILGLFEVRDFMLGMRLITQYIAMWI